MCAKKISILPLIFLQNKKFLVSNFAFFEKKITKNLSKVLQQFKS